MALTAKKVYAILNGKIKKVSGDVDTIATPLIFKGSISTADMLPISPEVGWMYNIESKSIYGEAGMNVAWTGTEWDSLGPAIDLSLYETAEQANKKYATKQEIPEELPASDVYEWAKQPNKPIYTAEEVGALPADTVISLTKEEKDQIEINRQNILKNTIRRTISGKTLLIQDSAEMPFVGMKQYGHTTQDTTTGAQLLNPELYLENTTPYVETHVNTDGSITYSKIKEPSDTAVYMLTHYIGEYADLLEDGQTYTFNCKVMTTAPDGTKNYFSPRLTVDKTTMASIQPYIQITVDDFVDGMTFYPMLNAGNTQLPWEPYTGGIPSPNPDYPQELVSAGDKGSIEVDVFGGNLLDISKTISQESSGIKLTNNGDGTLTVSGATTDAYFVSNTTTNVFNLPSGTYSFSVENDIDPGIQIIIRLFYTDGSATTAIVTSTRKSLFFEVNADAIEKIVFFIQVASNYTVNSTFKVMLNAGDAILPWEPYNKQAITYATPNGLPGIPVSSGGNYTDENGRHWIADYRDWERGVDVQCVHRGRYGNFYISNELENTKSLYRSVGIALIGGTTAVGFCDKLKWGYNQKDEPHFYWNNNAGNLVCYVNKDIEVSEFEVEILGALATPIETPIPADELSAYYAVHTNYPYTTIYNDESVWTEVEYVTETKDYIDNEITKTATALGGLTFSITENGIVRASWEEEGD